MNKFIIVIMGLVLSISIIATSSAQTPFPQVVSDLVAKAKSQIMTINMVGFKKVLDSQQEANIIDVREPNEYTAGHIPGAINIPRSVIEFRIWPLTGYPENTDMNKTFYIYCKTGGRCSLAALSLKELGLINVIAVDMLFADWQAAGYPITAEELN